MKVGILLITYNYLKWTEECLRTFEKYTDPNLYKLLIYDNYSTDGTIEFLKNKRLPFNTLKKDMSCCEMFVKALNTFQSDPEITHILQIHNDMLFTPNWLNKLLALFNSYRGHYYFASSFICGQGFFHLDDKDREVLAESAKDPKVGFANSCPQIYPMKLFDEVPPHDYVTFPTDCVDVDFNLRADRSGWSLLTSNDIVIFHVWGVSRFQAETSFVIAGNCRDRFVGRYGSNNLHKYNFTSKRSINFNGIPFTKRGA